MSTLSSSINSLSSSTVADWFGRNTNLKLARAISLVWAIVLISITLFLMKAIRLIVILGLNRIIYLWKFIRSILLTKLTFSSLHGVISGLILGIFSVMILSSIGVAWTWFILISVVVNITTLTINNLIFYNSSS